MHLFNIAALKFHLGLLNFFLFFCITFQPTEIRKCKCFYLTVVQVRYQYSAEVLPSLCAFGPGLNPPWSPLPSSGSLTVRDTETNVSPSIIVQHTQCSSLIMSQTTGDSMHMSMHRMIKNSNTNLLNTYGCLYARMVTHNLGLFCVTA